MSEKPKRVDSRQMKDLFGDKVGRAIELLRMYQPQDRPYCGCFSGGKDSCVIKEIARIGDVNVVWHYNVTTIDPPELVRFIKHQHPDVLFDIPKEQFFSMAIRKGFPSRKSRWCCEVYKETTSPDGAVLIMGIRAAESKARAARWREFGVNSKTKKYVVSPILSWTSGDVWNFIKDHNIPYCTLYDEGFKRLGCVGCPMSAHQKKEFARWPHFERRWRKLFKDIWEYRAEKLNRDWFGERNFNSSDEMFEWWLSHKSVPKKDDECQGILDMYA